MPSLIASDIVGVQPMTGPISSIWTLRHNFSKTPLIESIGEWESIIGTQFGYYVNTSVYNSTINDDTMLPIIEWCDNVLSDRYICTASYNSNKYTFYFEHEKERTMFLLKWGSNDAD